MDLVVDIFLVILLAAASLLCVYLITTLVEVRKTVAALRIDVKEIKDKVDPILSNVSLITDKAANLTQEIEDQVIAAKNIIINTKEKIGNIFDTDKRGNYNGEHSGPSWYRKIVGIYKGISTFLGALKT